MHLDNWLAQRAQTCPDRCALISAGRSLTYAELEREATAAARRLAARGARRGQTIALALAPGSRLRRPPARPDEARSRRLSAQHPAQRCRAQCRARAGSPGSDGHRLAGPRAHRGRPAAARRARPGSASLPDPHQRHLRERRSRSASPTATISGAPSDRRSTSASSPPTAGCAACRCSTSAASRSSCDR